MSKKAQKTQKSQKEANKTNLRENASQRANENCNNSK